MIISLTPIVFYLTKQVLDEQVEERRHSGGGFRSVRLLHASPNPSFFYREWIQLHFKVYNFKA